MNGSYYSNPMFTESTRMPENNFPNTNGQMLPMEQSYIENILRANIGKKATAFISFPDSVNWKDKMFTGLIEHAGRDHLIISDPATGKWFLIPMIYLDYVEFNEKIKYGL